MILGHYGVAFAAKRLAPRTSLGTLTLAAQWLDELWPILLLLGIERVRIVPGLMPASPLDFVHYPISHSLLTAAGWGALLGLGYYLVRGYRRGAWVVGLAVLSHWFLDVPVHRPDLPLWPGSDVLVGAGAWRSIPLTVALEVGLLAAGLFVYLRTTRARDRVGSWALWAMVAALVLIFAGGLVGPPPTDQRSLGFAALGLWLFVPWAYWIDRHREFRAVGGSVGVPSPSQPSAPGGAAAPGNR